jgi:hypothetical protein
MVGLLSRLRENATKTGIEKKDLALCHFPQQIHLLLKPAIFA